MKLLWGIFSAWLMRPLYIAAIVLLVVVVVVLFIQLKKAKNGSKA